MAVIDKITILLADGDALRRDGLSVILQGAPNFEVVAEFADGTGAFEGICNLQPAVAVVDLNLTGIHGIELVRRIRALRIPTKILILSASMEDDVIREVVRAGGDAYLLKNGPARHLIDAISYVRDGGQYFSPQLRRDGLDRRLMEEPARNPQDLMARPPDGDHDGADDEPAVRRPRRDYGYSAPPRRQPSPRSARGIRERMREGGDTGNLADRDYEILEMMADGIKPILDRLEEIEVRVGGMETGDEPVPSDLCGWLDSQAVTAFTTGGAQQGLTVRNMQDLESCLPKLIEQAVNSRFQAMAEKLHDEIEETHIRTLETFVKNIQVKIVQRVSALETDMTKQAEAMNQLREYSQRTEDNLSRLILGVDKLAQELPGRIAAMPAGASVAGQRTIRKRRGRSFLPKVFWGGVAVLVVAGAVGFWMKQPSKSTRDAAKAVSQAGDAAPKLVPIEIPSTADAKTRIQAAQEYTDRKEYSTAEDILKQVLKTDPANPDALKGLASVLYREDKIDESAAILEKLK